MVNLTLFFMAFIKWKKNEWLLYFYNSSYTLPVELLISEWTKVVNIKCEWYALLLHWSWICALKEIKVSRSSLARRYGIREYSIATLDLIRIQKIIIWILCKNLNVWVFNLKDNWKLKFQVLIDDYYFILSKAYHLVRISIYV